METDELERLKAGLILHTDTAKAAHVVLVEEYKALWAYYIRTLDERARIFDVYFKIVGMPFVLSGAVIFYLRSIDIKSQESAAIQHLQSQIEIIIAGMSLFFALSFIAGILAYLYYCLESANSRLYLKALTALRADWRTRYSLSDSLVIDMLRPKTRYLGDWIVHARGAVFAMFNSSMLFVAAWFYFGSSTLEWVVLRPIFSTLLFLSGVILHVVLGVLAMKLYARSPTGARIDQLLDRRLAAQTEQALRCSAAKEGKP